MIDTCRSPLVVSFRHEPPCKNHEFVYGSFLRKRRSGRYGDGEISEICARVHLEGEVKKKGTSSAALDGSALREAKSGEPQSMTPHLLKSQS